MTKGIHVAYHVHQVNPVLEGLVARFEPTDEYIKQQVQNASPVQRIDLPVLGLAIYDRIKMRLRDETELNKTRCVEPMVYANGEASSLLGDVAHPRETLGAALLSQVDPHWRGYEEAETEYHYYFAGLFQPDGQEFGGV